MMPPAFQNIWEGLKSGVQCTTCGIKLFSWLSQKAHTQAVCDREMERQRACLQANVDRMTGKDNATETTSNQASQSGESAYDKLEAEHYGRGCDPEAREPRDPDFCD